MDLYNERVWVIMSKDRKVIAKGQARNRHLVDVEDKNDRKRFLTYSTKNKAEAAFKKDWFYTYELPLNLRENEYDKDDMEAVECLMTLNTIKYPHQMHY